VITELAADEYAEMMMNTKIGLVSAIDKMFNLNSLNLTLSLFGLRNNRISILVGADIFQTKRFFSLLIFFASFLLMNSVWISQNNIHSMCQDTFDQVQSAMSQADFKPAAQSAICNQLVLQNKSVSTPPTSTPHYYNLDSDL
jgi:hypothetical protein